MTRMFRGLGLVASRATLLILAAIRHLGRAGVPEDRMSVQWDVHEHPTGLADRPVSPWVPVAVFLFVATSMICTAGRSAKPARSPFGALAAFHVPTFGGQAWHAFEGHRPGAGPALSRAWEPSRSAARITAPRRAC